MPNRWHIFRICFPLLKLAHSPPGSASLGVSAIFAIYWKPIGPNHESSKQNSSQLMTIPREKCLEPHYRRVGAVKPPKTEKKCTKTVLYKWECNVQTKTPFGNKTLPALSTAVADMGGQGLHCQTTEASQKKANSREVKKKRPPRFWISMDFNFCLPLTSQFWGRLSQQVLLVCVWPGG